MGQGYPGTVYTFERHLSIDPFLAFHQYLMLILLSALLASCSFTTRHLLLSPWFRRTSSIYNNFGSSLLPLSQNSRTFSNERPLNLAF
jgi:hypothetical protein